MLILSLEVCIIKCIVLFWFLILDNEIIYMCIQTPRSYLCLHEIINAWCGNLHCFVYCIIFTFLILN